MPNKEIQVPPVAVITGGTTGIGGATARELASRGYNLLLVALDDPDSLAVELTLMGVRAEFLRADLSNAASAAKVIVDRCISLFGRLDLLINCAGVIHHKELTAVTEHDWDRIFAVNLKAPYFLIQQSYPYLKLNHGSIVNVSSMNAVKPMKENQLYDSLKAALNNLTQGFALEFREAGVRVNAVMPGGVRTPLVENWLTQYLGREAIESDFEDPAIATPERIAQVIAALASPELAWINGSIIPVDGGYWLG